MREGRDGEHGGQGCGAEGEQRAQLGDGERDHEGGGERAQGHERRERAEARDLEGGGA